MRLLFFWAKGIENWPHFREGFFIAAISQHKRTIETSNSLHLPKLDGFTYKLKFRMMLSAMRIVFPQQRCWFASQPP